MPKKTFFILFICAIVVLSGLQFADAQGLDSAGDLLNQAGKYSGIDTETSDARLTVGRIISLVLGFVGVVFLGLTVYGGMLWMTAAGNEDRVKKGKDVIVRAIIGMAIVFLAYAITFLISFYIVGVS